MANNHEKCSNDITLEKLTRAVQIYWGCTYFGTKNSEGTCFEVASLVFGNFW